MQLRRWVRTFDDVADRYLDRVRGNPAADRLMYTASELGDFSLIWHIVGVGQALRPGRQAESALRASVILGIEAALVNGPIKSLTKRERPVHVTIRPHRLRTPRTTSFPSGHASSAFTFAGIMAPGDPLAPLYYGLAVVVASSRMYVRIHHASDVVAGAALGTALAAVANKVWPPLPSGG